MSTIWSTPTVAFGPWFVTVKSHGATPLAITPTVLVNSRSTSGTTGVGSVARSLSGFRSVCGDVTDATFVTDGHAAGPTSATSVNDAEASTANTPASSQVTVVATSAHVQPAPVADTNVSPAGMVSADRDRAGVLRRAVVGDGED